MTAEELALCVIRHATSKLTDDAAMFITTLGFRGEALPSIGAAARLCITSRVPGADHANTVSVEGGVISAVIPAAAPTGTQVAVRDLFFATPARLKFLKGPRAEATQIELVVRRLALAAPDVAFRLEIGERTVFDLPAQARIERVAALLGINAPNGLLAVEERRSGIYVGGYVCSPTVNRITPSGQVLIVNNRPVIDPVLRAAVKIAYRDVIPAGRHAVVALYLQLPPEDVDVNVHPAKVELRFRDADGVRGAVIGAVRRALGVTAGTVVSAAHVGTSWAGYASRPGPPLTAAISPSNLAEAQLPFHASPAARQFAPAEPVPEHPLGAPVAQVLDTYIIAVAADGSLVLVDQHAAHERLTDELIRAQMLCGGVRSQPLLLPAVVDLPAADVMRLSALAEELERLGLELEAFGPGAILVRALPAALGPAEPAPLVRDLAEEIAELGEQTVLSAQLDAIIARLACHGSIRAGRKLGIAEMNALLRQMEQTPRAATCSHGRPTVLKLSKADIERMFGRR
jgi:DNA mismatch repair protein MutL